MPRSASAAPPAAGPETTGVAEPRPDIYAEFVLTADLGHLSDNQRQMIGVLIEASEIMDDLFWRQAYGDGYEEWLDSIGIDEVRRFAELNYGPWDRLADEAPFIEGVAAIMEERNSYKLERKLLAFVTPSERPGSDRSLEELRRKYHEIREQEGLSLPLRYHPATVVGASRLTRRGQDTREAPNVSGSSPP